MSAALQFWLGVLKLIFEFVDEIFWKAPVQREEPGLLSQYSDKAMG
jgi:hypothetical protein